jgi:hypothetical protein
MQHYIQSVHIKLSYFTIKLQSNTHLTYYSPNNQKDLKLNLDRALGGQLIKIGYLLKTSAESIGNKRDLADRKVHRFPNWSMKASITVAEPTWIIPAQVRESIPEGSNVLQTV